MLPLGGRLALLDLPRCHPNTVALAREVTLKSPRYLDRFEVFVENNLQAGRARVRELESPSLFTPPSLTARHGLAVGRSVIS